MKNYINRSLSIRLIFKAMVSFFLSFFLTLAVCFFITLLVANVFYSSAVTQSILENIRIYPSIQIILMLSIYLLGIAIFVISFLWMIKNDIKYIKYIAKQIKLIANENLGLTIEVRGKDELAELSMNINSMSKELKYQFEKERDVERTKTELITNISHDLRTPLTSMIGYLDFLRTEKFKDEKEQKEYINSTYNLSIKLKKLIDELFEYTKLSGGEVQLELIEVDICAVLNQLLGEYVPILEEKELKIAANIPDSELIVKIDIEKMVRVFENILSNAEKYSYKPSEIVVSIEKKDDHVLICFSNRGEHIAQENINKLFDRFYRIDTSRSNNIPGAGLGLAISKKIVELHNGKIWAESSGDMIDFKIMLELIK